jgi:hypothetical protein
MLKNYLKFQLRNFYYQLLFLFHMNKKCENNNKVLSNKKVILYFIDFFSFKIKILEKIKNVKRTKYELERIL